MEDSTDEFDTLVLNHHKRLSRAVIFNYGKIVEDTYYQGDNFRMDREGTSVNFSRNSDTRTTASLSLYQIASNAQTLIDPLIYPEVELYSGLMTSAGPEWILMGTLGITDDNVTRTGSLIKHDLNCVDRSSRLRDNPFNKTTQFAKDTDYFAAMRTIMNSQAKGFTPLFNHGTSTFLMPDTILNEEEDPWAAILKYAEAVSCETYFDRRGVHVCLRIANTMTQPPALRFSPSDHDVLVSPTTMATSNRDVFNGVICKGEAPWLLFPISGETWDMDPISPTYRPNFGDKPKKITDAIATTNAQCQAIADAEWNKIKGIVNDIDFGLICDPRIDVGDVIQIENTQLGISGRFILESYKYPFGSEKASGTVKRHR